MKDIDQHEIENPLGRVRVGKSVIGTVPHDGGSSIPEPLNTRPPLDNLGTLHFASLLGSHSPGQLTNTSYSALTLPERFRKSSISSQ